MEFLWYDCVICIIVPHTHTHTNIYIYIYIYIYVYFVGSPYLLVFGDDRVRGTREQMMLQVDLETHGNNFIEFLSLMVLE